MKYLSTILVVLLVLSCSSVPKKEYPSGNIEKFSQDAAKKMGDAAIKERLLRIVLIPPVSTAGKYKHRRFSSFLNSALVREFKRMRRFRIFERRRLNVIMKEKSLRLSGLVKGSDAKKIGQIAPVDAIVTGSFTVMSKYVDINLRLIDTVTGEIKEVFRGNIFISSHMKSFFYKSYQNNNLNNRTDCETIYEKTKDYLRYLRKKEDIAKAVDYFITIPFDKNCGKIHNTVIYRFKRKKILNEKYRRFLLNSLASIEYPGEDRRAFTIISYLGADGSIDDEEWNIALGAVKRSSYRWFGRNLRYLFSYRGKAMASKKKIELRIDEYMTEVKLRRVGKPVAFSFSKGLMQLYQNLHKYPLGRVYIIKKYISELEERKIRYLTSRLSKDFKKENDVSIRKEILPALCLLHNKRKSGRSLRRDLITLENHINKRYWKNRNRVYALEMKVFLKYCRKTMEREFNAVETFRNEKKSIIMLCLKYQIPYKYGLPTKRDIRKKILLGSYREKKFYFYCLYAMGKRGRFAESTVLKIIRRYGRRRYYGSTNDVGYAMRALVTMKSRSRQAIIAVVPHLGSRSSHVKKYASATLRYIGRPAVPYIVQEMRKYRGKKMIPFVKTLEKMGPKASYSLRFLRQLKRYNKNEWLSDALEDAINAISQKRTR